MHVTSDYPVWVKVNNTNRLLKLKIGIPEFRICNQVCTRSSKNCYLHEPILDLLNQVIYLYCNIYRHKFYFKLFNY